MISPALIAAAVAEARLMTIVHGPRWHECREAWR